MHDKKENACVVQKQNEQRHCGIAVDKIDVETCVERDVMSCCVARQLGDYTVSVWNTNQQT